MAITIRCPNCGASLRLDDSLAGRKVRCSGCRETIVATVDREDDEPPRRSSLRKPAVDQPLIPTRNRSRDPDEDRPAPMPVWKREVIGGAVYFAVIGGFMLIASCGGGFAFYFFSKQIPPIPPPPVAMNQADAQLDDLLADLRSIDPAQRVSAAQRLRMGEPNIPRRDEVALALAACLKDTNAASAESAAGALEKWATPAVAMQLSEALKSDSSGVRKSSLRALGLLKEPATFEAIAHCLATPERSDAARALDQIGQPAERAVISRLDHSDSGVRAEACRLLAHIGSKEAIERLEARRNADTDPVVILTAEKAIRAIQGRNP